LASPFLPDETNEQYTARMTALIRQHPTLSQFLPAENLNLTLTLTPSENPRSDELRESQTVAQTSTSAVPQVSQPASVAPSPSSTRSPENPAPPTHDSQPCTQNAEREETPIARQIREENIARERLGISVYNYTMRRCDEYNAWRENKKYNGIQYDNSKPFFSELKECPCGQATPCPEHGEMPTFFWKNSPWSFLYIKVLDDYGFPFHPMRLPDGPPGECYSDPSRWRPDD
jgi:hypothetical protein